MPLSITTGTSYTSNTSTPSLRKYCIRILHLDSATAAGPALVIYGDRNGFGTI